MSPGRGAASTVRHWVLNGTFDIGGLDRSEPVFVADAGRTGRSSSPGVVAGGAALWHTSRGPEGRCHRDERIKARGSGDCAGGRTPRVRHRRSASVPAVDLAQRNDRGTGAAVKLVALLAATATSGAFAAFGAVVSQFASGQGVIPVTAPRSVALAR